MRKQKQAFETYQTVQTFIDYVLSFYGPQQIYGEYFDHNLKREEVLEAVKLRLENETTPFDGDSVDREIVRDLMLKKRGKPVSGI
jgi:hypothetical protein